MSDDPLNFEEHRRRLQKGGLVRCAHCGEMILGTSIRCPECGVHFEGAAEDHVDPTGAGRGTRTWVLVVAVLLLAAILLTTFTGL